MKAIFVDNGSLEFMCQALGITHINYQELLHILSGEVGTAPVGPAPLITIRTNANPAVIEFLQRYGFEIVPYQSGSGDDDRIIIDRIAQLDPAEITEIILVSADFGYAEILKTKWEEGMNIFLAGARVNDRVNGKPMIGQRYDHFLGKIFNFIDLAEYAERLKYRRPQKKIPQSGAGQAAALPASAANEGTPPVWMHWGRKLNGRT